MELIRAEGIVLHSFPYRDYDQILTVFTRDLGVVKLIMRGGRSSRRGTAAAMQPLSEAEFVFKGSSSDLQTCREVSILNLHLSLRQSMDALNSACALIQAIHRSQMQGKKAPDLYDLLTLYLHRFETALNRDALVTSFLLKLLRHEGLLHLQATCSSCDQPLDEWVLVAGECYCKRHAPLPLPPLRKNEVDLLTLLTHSRSFHTLEEVVISENLHHQIATLFESLIH